MRHRLKADRLNRLIKAVERATFYGAFNYTIIKKIVQTGLDQIAPADDIYPQTSLPFHDNIRGPEHYDPNKKSQT